MTRIARSRKPVQFHTIDPEVIEQIRIAVEDGNHILGVSQLFGVSRYTVRRAAFGLEGMAQSDLLAATRAAKKRRQDEAESDALPPGKWVKDPAKPWRLIYQPDEPEVMQDDLAELRARRAASAPACGTSTGYQWHLALGETCDVCKAAASARRRKLRERRRAEREAS